MHKKIWFKIHLYLGLTAGIVLMVIGVTGAMLSFEKEILWLVNKNSYVVKASGPKQNEKEIIDNFKLKFPKAKIKTLSIKNDDYSSVVINIASNAKGKAGRRGINYYINPYTSEILPDVEGKKVFKFIESIHRRLVAGEVGKQIVGACTLMLLLLMLSGIYVYLPRLKRAFFKSFTFKFKNKGRNFLSTMHSALGMWVIPFFILATLTGLYWSYHWYNDLLHSITGVEQRAHKRPTPSNNKTRMKKNNTQKQVLSSEKVQKIFDLFKENITDYKSADLKFEGKKEIYTISYIKKDPIHYRAKNEISLDIKNHTIIKHEEFSNKPLEERLMKSMLPLHTGEYFGRVGQILMFISSLSMALFTITGFMMYFQRKKKKKKQE